eukprot:5367907-Heterocapsa_arctica.AAC.1
MLGLPERGSHRGMPGEASHPRLPGPGQESAGDRARRPHREGKAGPPWTMAQPSLPAGNRALDNGDHMLPAARPPPRHHGQGPSRSVAVPGPVRCHLGSENVDIRRLVAPQARGPRHRQSHRQEVAGPYASRTRCHSDVAREDPSRPRQHPHPGSRTGGQRGQVAHPRG